jgi:hypothetical protein
MSTSAIGVGYQEFGLQDMVIDSLKSNFNRTASFDGGTKRQQAVYTIYFTTPDGRSFRIRGEECSDESQTSSLHGRC